MDESNATQILVIISALFMGVMGTLWLVRWVVTRRWNQHKASTVLKWEAEGVEFVYGPVGGQFSGLESMGVNKVIRGIGFVVLTDKDLRVTRSAPAGVWSVTLKQIKGVALHSTFLGNRSKKTPYIVVRFKKGGKGDKLGFQVKPVEDWAEAVAQAAGVKVKDRRSQ